LQIYDQVRSALVSGASAKSKAGKGATAKLSPPEELEVWLALANFEWLPATAKLELGQSLLEKLRKGEPKRQELWALSRLGARIPLYGPLDRLIPNTAAAEWVQSLLALRLAPGEQVGRALVQLARFTGDRARDVPEELRSQVLDWLAQLPNGGRLQELLLNPESEERPEEQEWLFGEALPAGLVLRSVERRT
jgi:hypothetical protein